MDDIRSRDAAQELWSAEDELKAGGHQQEVTGRPGPAALPDKVLAG
jgi:hypothetical protein